MNQTIVFVLLPVASLVLLRSEPFRGFLRVRFGRESGPSVEPSLRSWRGWARFLTPLLSGIALGYSPVWMGRLLGWYEPALGPVVPPWQAVRPPRPFRSLSWNGRLAVSSGSTASRRRRFSPRWRWFFSPFFVLRYGRRLNRPRRTEPPGFEGLDLVGAIVGSGAAVFFLQNLDPSQVRYLAPVLPAALALLLVSSRGSGDAPPAENSVRFRVAPRRWARSRRRPSSSRGRRGVSSRASFSSPTPGRRSGRSPRRATPSVTRDTITAYTLQFLSDERVRFIPYHSPDRNRTLSAALRSIPGPQCLVTDDGTVRRWLPSDAAQEGGPARRRAEKR